MSQAERGLFERIQIASGWPLRQVFAPRALDEIKAIIAEFEQRLAEAERDKEIALDLLVELFDKYENGDDCYEDPEECAEYIGKAFRLQDEIFDACVDLLNRLRPVTAPLPESKHE